MLITYFIVPKRMKNAVLLAGSLVFYAWGEVKYVLLMVISILIGYISGRWIDHFRGMVRAKWGLMLSVGIHLGLLGLFKYMDFFIESINLVFHSHIDLLRIALPLGISFFTITQIAFFGGLLSWCSKREKSYQLRTFCYIFSTSYCRSYFAS